MKKETIEGRDAGVTDHPRTSRRGPLGLGVLALLTFGSACQLLLNNESLPQCSTDADCAGRNIYAGSRPAICGPDKTCITPPSFCNTVADCPAAAPDAGTIAVCQSNACGFVTAYPCQADNECGKYFDAAPAYCNGGQCIQIASETCRPAVGNADCIDKQRPICDTASSTCVACLQDADCRPFFPGAADTDFHCANKTCALYPPEHCFHNTECIKKDKDDGGTGASICINSACTSLLSQDCQSILGTEQEYSKDNVLVLGTEFVVNGSPLATQGLGAVQAVTLARNHFQNVFQGMPGPNGARPFIYVVCNELNPVQAATHLVNDLHVPAIVGLHTTADDYQVATTVTGINGGLAVTMTNSPSGSISILNDGVSFKVASNDLDYINLYNLAVQGIEKQLETAGTITANTLRVAVLYRGDITGTYLEPLLRQKLTYNGGVAAQDQLDKYKAFDLGYHFGESAADTKTATDTAVAQAVAFQPHFIVLLGSGELLQIAEALEASWPASATLPHYMFYASAQFVQWSTWGAGGVSANPSLRSRILGVSASLPASATPKDTLAAQVLANANAEAVQNFAVPDGGAGDAGDAGVPPGNYFANNGAAFIAYDSAHLIQLANIAASAKADGGTYTGKDVGAALRSSFSKTGLQTALTGGAPPNDTATVLSTAAGELKQGRPIEYYGITGPVQFDNTDTYSHFQIFLWCIGGTNSIAPTGIYYNPGDATPSGTCGGACATANACP